MLLHWKKKLIFPLLAGINDSSVVNLYPSVEILRLWVVALLGVTYETFTLPFITVTKFTGSNEIIL